MDETIPQSPTVSVPELWPGEWFRELGDEVRVPALGRLPLLLSRRDVATLKESGRALERLAWRVLYATGMREGELLALERSALGENFVQLADRKAVIDTETLRELHQVEGERLFPWTAEQLLRKWIDATRRCGLLVRYTKSERKSRPAALRHAFAAHRLEDGMDLFTLRLQLGHSTLRTTQKYLELAIGRWRTEYQRCHPLGPSERFVVRARNERDLRPPGGPLIRGGVPAELTLTDMQALMSVGKNDRNRLIVRLFYASGIRVGEMERLCFLDLDVAEGRLFVRQGKGDWDRYTLIDPATAQALEDWRGTTDPGYPVFGLSARHLHRVVTGMAKTAGLEKKFAPLGQGVFPHSLRHAHATHCYEAGIDLFGLKKLLGHAYLKTTEIYVTSRLEQRVKVYKKTSRS